MDHFDKKREVVKSLMGMLKSHANQEMAPKHEVSMEKVSVKPADKMSDLSAPHSDQMVPASCDHEMCSGGACKMMSDGGMAMPSDEPENVMPSELPAEDGAEHSVDMGEMEDEDEDNNQSAFMGLLKKKK